MFLSSGALFSRGGGRVSQSECRNADPAKGTSTHTAKVEEEAELTHRERVLTALGHREADSVPLDLGGTFATTIVSRAYAALRDRMGFQTMRSPHEVKLSSFAMQLAHLDEEFLQGMRVDTRGVFPGSPDTWKRAVTEDEFYRNFIDEWGITWRMPKEGGFYYDMVDHPLNGAGFKEIETYSWPDGRNKGRFEGLREEACRHRDGGFFVLFGNTIGNGFLHTGTWLAGYEHLFYLLSAEPSLASRLLDRILEVKIDYWDAVLSRLSDVIDAVYEGDDLGTQNGPLISPSMYRKYIKPRQAELFAFIKRRSPETKIFFHSCGSVSHLIPDLIEVGVDILNPIQVSAAHMDVLELKKSFGRDITFWGGGVDTQEVLPRGTPGQVKDDVRMRIEALAPGGGFVFAAVHNIQADVPPDNILAMWEAWQEYGRYS